MNQDTDDYNQWTEKLTPDAPLFHLPDWHRRMFINFPWLSYEANTARIMESIDLLMESKDSEGDLVKGLWDRAMTARTFVSEDMSILMLGSMAYPLVSYVHERITFYHALVSLGQTSPRYQYSFGDDGDMTEEQGQRMINIHELEKLVETRFHGGKEVALGLEVWKRYIKEKKESISRLRQSILASAFGEDVPSEAPEAISSLTPIYKLPRVIKDKTMYRYECWFRQYVEIEQKANKHGEKFVADAAHNEIAAPENKDGSTIAKGIKIFLETTAKKVLGIFEIS